MLVVPVVSHVGSGGTNAPVIRAITLTKNSQFYVRQGDVERLIAQGYLQKLS